MISFEINGTYIIRSIFHISQVFSYSQQKNMMTVLSILYVKAGK